MRFEWIAYPIMIVMIGGCATRSDLRLLNDNLEQMKRDLTRRQEAGQSATDEVLARHEDTFRGQHAETRINLEQLREELRGITGRLEEIEHTVQGRDGRLSGEKAGRIDTMEEMLNSNLQRIMRLEAYVGMESSGEKVPEPEAQTKPVADLTEDQQYEIARGHYTRGEMENAREEFTKLLNRFPRSKYAGNSQFWIGETYYNERWYEKAILEYQKVIEQYPDSNKLQAALLKQGLAFHMLNEISDARLILNELIRKHPNSNEAKIAAQKLKEIK